MSATEAYAEARRRGICTRCPVYKKEPALPGRSLCWRHATLARRYNRDRYKRRLKAGVCDRCGRAPREVGIYCVSCAERRKKLPSNNTHAGRDRNVRQNLCADGCGRSAYKGTRCLDCAELARQKQRQRVQKRIDAGLCTKCGKVRVRVPGTSCTKCRKKRRVSNPKNPTAIRCGACGGDHRCTSPRCSMRDKVPC